MTTGQEKEWTLISQSPMGTTECRRENDDDRRALWRVRCTTPRYVANPRWHRAGPMPLGARWAGDTRDVACLVEMDVREVSVVSTSSTIPPSPDAIAAALVVSGLAGGSSKQAVRPL
ncbi:hypothetical protein pmac_cds_909 [Pandoravirus macleodensis]|uniref:Uncharacterized protein n=1 Tax=Pandoravirus macleodensis TaxID=2107707 RepID=A0A2U7UGH1_9VIRU|nr:hypothetical protein pmac_cds_909 [Pandoravirus macleodensis]AVK77597.1 hypothetical protein pmac_cds_909 [Pandoravirus macleodensis]